MVDGGQWAWHACPTRGGTWLLPCNGGHILQAILIWLDASFPFFTYYKEYTKAYEVDVLDIDWSVKSTFLFQSYKELDGEKLDDIINFLDQMLLEKNVDINEGY